MANVGFDSPKNNLVEDSVPPEDQGTHVDPVVGSGTSALLDATAPNSEPFGVSKTTDARVIQVDGRLERATEPTLQPKGAEPSSTSIAPESESALAPSSSSSEAVNLPSVEERDDIFPLKPIKFFDPHTDSYRTVKILLQNKFGPCAALALCNVLVLRGELSLEGEHVTYDTLAALLGDLLIAKVESKGGAAPSSPSVEGASPIDRVGDVLTLLPALRRGLDIDVYFGDIRGFEESPALSVFKVFQVDLLHGA